MLKDIIEKENKMLRAEIEKQRDLIDSVIYTLERRGIVSQGEIKSVSMPPKEGEDEEENGPSPQHPSRENRIARDEELTMDEMSGLWDSTLGLMDDFRERPSSEGMEPVKITTSEYHGLLDAKKELDDLTASAFKPIEINSSQEARDAIDAVINYWQNKTPNELDGRVHAGQLAALEEARAALNSKEQVISDGFKRLVLVALEIIMREAAGNQTIIGYVQLLFEILKQN